MKQFALVALVVILPVLVGLLTSLFIKKKKKRISEESATVVDPNDINKTFMMKDVRFNMNAFQHEYKDVPLLLGPWEFPMMNQVIGTALVTQQEQAEEIKITIDVMDPVQGLQSLVPAIAGNILEMTEDGQITKFQLRAVNLVPEGTSLLKVI